MSSAGVIAVASMLHESPDRPGSASRKFHGRPVLAWTLSRLSRCANLNQIAILCWQDQREQSLKIASEFGARCIAPSARVALPALDILTTARRWSDGWRGGLLNTCEFDRGFHAPLLLDLLNQLGGDAAYLVDPAAGLVDPDLIDALLDHAAGNEEIDFFFTPAAPGLSGVMIRKSLVEKLAKTSTHPGALLAYRPDLPQRDPISTPACAAVAAPLARTSHRFTLDSNRQIDRFGRATDQLNGELIGTSAEQLLELLSKSQPSPAPREIVLELTPRRNTRPIYLPASIERADLSLESAMRLLDELATIDDLRLVLAGAGDPLLSPAIFEILCRATELGVATALETDLVGIDESAVARLAKSGVDVVSVHLPAAAASTYQTVMQIDGFQTCLKNLQILKDQRAATPLIVPTFTKLQINLAEMEPWYDHWLRLLGCAVIVGPSDFSGSIPDVSAARMEPPRRSPCARLNSRMTILCDGRIVSCEQDLLGKQTLGQIGRDSIQSVWTGAMANLRADHKSGNWQRHALCAACSDWHRA
jgi:spore coat polysaccharide biosynthesis protein SpsF (cytidylyltransferase family)